MTNIQVTFSINISIILQEYSNKKCCCLHYFFKLTPGLVSNEFLTLNSYAASGVECGLLKISKTSFLILILIGFYKSRYLCSTKGYTLRFVSTYSLCKKV